MMPNLFALPHAALRLCFSPIRNKIRSMEILREPGFDISAELEYVGFWPRAFAALFDLMLAALFAIPALIYIYENKRHEWGSSGVLAFEVLLLWVMPAVAIIAFWRSRQATPGKMALTAIIIDEKTAGPPSIWQHCGRYLAYFVSLLPFGLGFVWIAFDNKKQGWHDKMAGTLVVRARPRPRP